MHSHRIGPDRKAPPLLVRQPLSAGVITRPPKGRRYRTRGLRLPRYKVEHRGGYAVFWLVRVRERSQAADRR